MLRYQFDPKCFAFCTYTSSLLKRGLIRSLVVKIKGIFFGSVPSTETPYSKKKIMTYASLQMDTREAKFKESWKSSHPVFRKTLFYTVFNPILTGWKELISACALIHLKIVAQPNLQGLLGKFEVSLLKMNLCEKGKLAGCCLASSNTEVSEWFWQNRNCPITVTTLDALGEI